VDPTIKSIVGSSEKIVEEAILKTTEERVDRDSEVGRSEIGQDRNCAVLILAEIPLNMENEHRF
jgi:hypothetical protein